MRVVLDTNVLVSGLLWNGPPRQILDAVRLGSLDLYISPSLLDELSEVLVRPKFAERLAAANVAAFTLVGGVAALATIVRPVDIEATISADPDDDDVLACAVAAGAVRIVSGDDHLLSLGSFRGIQITTASHLVAELKL